MKASLEEIFAAKQEVASEMMAMIRRRRPLNEMEKRLLDALVSEIGVKYLLLPSVEGFRVEARQFEEDRQSSVNWF